MFTTIDLHNKITFLYIIQTPSTNYKLCNSQFSNSSSSTLPSAILITYLVSRRSDGSLGSRELCERLN